MSVQRRNNVHVRGAGPITVVFAHGFGCDQRMWRLVEPAFAPACRTVLFDLVGSGESDASQYDSEKYSSLEGYAQDIIDVIDEFGEGRILFVGHSVSAMAGAVAAIRRPGLIDAHAMIGPSPCYLNDGAYPGGFSREDIDSLLDALESNYLGWSSAMAPSIMGNEDKPELGIELTDSFCRTDPDIAKRFARVTFLSDCRDTVARLKAPTLIVQSSEDFIAAVAVGEYLAQTIENSRLDIIENVGHCPHMSQPQACIASIQRFIRDTWGTAEHGV
jgi:sigma-B regulation protein RsbQ